MAGRDEVGRHPGPEFVFARFSAARGGTGAGRSANGGSRGGSGSGNGGNGAPTRTSKGALTIIIIPHRVLDGGAPGWEDVP